MSRLAYYPTPANRKLGIFTLSVCIVSVVVRSAHLTLFHRPQSDGRVVSVFGA